MQQSYWKQYYVLETDADEIEGHLQRTTFLSGGKQFELIYFIIVPQVKLPISSYLDWKELIDTREGNRAIETRLVREGYLHDPDFDRWYPLSAIMSLLLTPPPQPLTALQIPTMFLLALRGFGGCAFVEYVKDVYQRLPNVKKQLVEVDGSVYWMLSHPKEAASVVCEWFDETLSL